MQVKRSVTGWLCGCVASALVVGQTATAEVTLPPVFGSGMVLQRGMNVPVWGQSEAGATVTVTVSDQKQSVQADARGTWRVLLDPLATGGPYELAIVSGDSSVTMTNVLVGEVWLGSGQSNMAGSTKGYTANDSVLAEMQASGPYPRLRLCWTSRGGWHEATPETMNGFSALHFAFGLRLHQELDVPVGLMVGAVGGTPSALWLSREMLDADAASQVLIDAPAAQERFERDQENYPGRLERWTNLVAQAKAAGRRVPRKPYAPAAPGQSYRGEVGSLYKRFIEPVASYGIRGVLWDQGEAGTSLSDVEQDVLMGALIRGWRVAWQQDAFPFLYVQKPSGGGCAWDPSDPVTAQADAFAALPGKAPGANDGAHRARHIRIMAYPNTWMVTSSDLGGMTHPINKSGYGTRAARVALGAVYDKPVEVYGPVYLSHTVEGNRVRVHFTHVGRGLAAKHGDHLQGFAVEGPDGVPHWADAQIDGDTVMVSSDEVPAPVIVSYGWAGKHPWANLFNKDGLPALAFRAGME